jgi:hypothetical protein
MRILLLNETGIVPHLGCLAVADAHARMLGSMGHQVVRRRPLGDLTHLWRGDERASLDAALSDESLRADIESCDAVVLNAEGSIHHGHGLHWLAALGAAQRLGRRTLIVNAVLQESPGFDGVLRAVDDLCVRDARSAAYLRSRGVPCRVVPDSFAHARFDDEAAIELSGRTVLTDWHADRNADVGRAMVGLWRSLPDDRRFYFPFFHGAQRLLWRSAVATIRRADVLVTARHHGVCLAARAGVPFVALPGNTYKIEGMIEASGLPIPVCSTGEQLEAGLAFARQNPGVFREFADYVRRSMPLTTFRALAQAAETRPLDGESAAENEVRRLAEQTRGIIPWTTRPALWNFGLQAELRPAAAAAAGAPGDSADLPGTW